MFWEYLSAAEVDFDGFGIFYYVPRLPGSFFPDREPVFWPFSVVNFQATTILLVAWCITCRLAAQYPFSSEFDTHPNWGHRLYRTSWANGS